MGMVLPSTASSTFPIFLGPAAIALPIIRLWHDSVLSWRGGGVKLARWWSEVGAVVE
jgi:hypothetical protein